MIILQAQGVARSFNGLDLFTGINLAVQTGARVGLVGPNGIGKTTLLEILAGINPPDAGHVTTSKNLSLGYLAQDSGLTGDNTVFNEMLTVFAPVMALETRMHDLEKQLTHDASAAVLAQYDQVQHDFTEQNGYGYRAEIRGVLHGFHFDDTTYDKPIHTLSGGERSRLALAKLLLERHDLIILDEPTNHLDIDTLTWLEGYLRGYPGAILTVSHDQYFLDHVVTEVYELGPTQAVHYTTNYTGYKKQKAENLALEWKAYEKQQEEIAKLQDFIDKNIVRASTTKQAQARRKQLEKMPRLARPAGREKTVHFQFTPATTSGNEVLQVRGATVGYEAAKPMAGPIDFAVNKGDRIAIIGPNGVGKSTLLKSILGQIPFLKGSARFGTGVTTGYYDQDQHQLHWNKTVLAEIWDEHPTMLEKDVRAALAAFLFDAEDITKTVADLSGGQKARLELTKLSLMHDNFLVLDEPTNHLDINSKEVLEEALADFSGTVLFVSHDRYFINSLATSIVALAPTGSTTYLGDWDYYQEKLAETTAEAAADAPAAEAAPAVAATAYSQSKEAQRNHRKLEREVAKWEAELTRLEEAAAAVQTDMAAPAALTDYVKMQELQAKLDAITAATNEAETAWEQAAEALEELES
ncbi:ABC-F family ATP-binding cassette domain-containing protein [Lacticaseibacillus nasuensis]|uniref:ABC transporter ATP-binding protein n=1 Tax=Lacticaseibacillus nasuensis JCM 17158 TaxID=1291734 RepID=A0A0R1JP59_9LACO|nr:ABC-F family ATP-binding cassette domain-containing protein [Lacticaseibacillus nasuensis]KRK70361.1 ABC transporter ATP-binding protein [Lacticaseibacillus nasuensis JCM 17158]